MGRAVFVLGGLDRTPGELGEGFVCWPSLVGVGLGDGIPGHLHRGVEGGAYLVSPGGLVLDEQHAWGRPPYRVGDFVLLRAALVIADAPDRAVQLWHVGILPSVKLHLAPRRDRKSTRLNSSHVARSYAVFCSKQKTRPGRGHTRQQLVRTCTGVGILAATD